MVEVMGETHSGAETSVYSASSMQKMPCASCGRGMERQDVKFVLPSSAFGSRGMPQTNRLLCGSCFKRYAIRRRSMMRQAAKHRVVQSVRFARSVMSRA